MRTVKARTRIHNIPGPLSAQGVDTDLTDAQRTRIESLTPSSEGCPGRPFRNHRSAVVGIIYRFRAGIAWRDPPESFGPCQTVWKRHRPFSGDGTWDRIHTRLLAETDAVGKIDWEVSVDSTVNRAHKHATNLPRATGSFEKGFPTRYPKTFTGTGCCDSAAP